LQLEAWALSKSPVSIVHFEAVTANLYLVRGSIRAHANTLCTGLIRNESRRLLERLERQLQHFAQLHRRLLQPPEDTAQLSKLSQFVKEVEGSCDGLRAEVFACRKAFEALEQHGAGLTDELVAAMWNALDYLRQLRVRSMSWHTCRHMASATHLLARSSIATPTLFQVLNSIQRLPCLCMLQMYRPDLLVFW
jgi:hypothetical protein